MNHEDKLEEMYGMFMDYQQKLHEQNQKKIRIGLKVNILLPLVFLIISFLSKGSKLIFLILWIVSLFGIAFYLLYVEFTDHKVQEKMKEFGILDEEHEKTALIGGLVVEGEAAVSEKMDQIDEKIDENKQRIEAELAEQKEKIVEQKEKIVEQISRIKDNKGGKKE